MQRSVTVFPNRDAVVGAAILATLRAMLVSSRRSELEEAGIIGFSMSTYYELRSGPAPWGDYGYELWNGFTEESEERDQPAILVSRTGPFVAPITVSFGRILVTEDFRRKLVAERFGSFIRARWVQEGRPHCVGAWDANAQVPAFYPETREPEDYLLEGAHDEQLAATMPNFGRGPSLRRSVCKFNVVTPSVESFTPARMWRENIS